MDQQDLDTSNRPILKLKTSKNPSEATFFFSTCEYLISDDGSLLISSNQIAEKKLKELPSNFIIFATTSQFVETIGEGLKGIKEKNKSKIPPIRIDEDEVTISPTATAATTTTTWVVNPPHEDVDEGAIELLHRRNEKILLRPLPIVVPRRKRV